VLSTVPICHEHARIELILNQFPPSRPGQFLQILCHASDEPMPRSFDWSDDGRPMRLESVDWIEGTTFLRRPFSIGDRWEDESGRTHLVIISRNVGPGTAWLERIVAGDVLDVTGPLGHGFRLPNDERPMFLIGGGVGIPPLLYLSRVLNEAGKRDVTMIFGALRGELLPVRLTDEPARDGSPRPCVAIGDGGGYPTSVSTDDGSRGVRGVVTDVLRIVATQAGKRAPAATVFACGPEKMLRAVAAMTQELGWDCQLCIERKMGCGLGTCLSCIVRVRAPEHESGWRWALTCKDGPVFDRDELME
jgi:dihydroorotate dehydrogenase electron transfer subunit